MKNDISHTLSTQPDENNNQSLPYPFSHIAHTLSQDRVPKCHARTAHRVIVIGVRAMTISAPVVKYIGVVLTFQAE